jgi:hypothetical protein
MTTGMAKKPRGAVVVIEGEQDVVAAIHGAHHLAFGRGKHVAGELPPHFPPVWRNSRACC